MTTIFLGCLIFSTVFCLAAGALLLATDFEGRRRRQLNQRLTSLKSPGSIDSTESLLCNAAGRLAFLRLGRLPSLEKLQLRLIQAGLHCRLDVFLLSVLRLGNGIGSLRDC